MQEDIFDSSFLREKVGDINGKVTTYTYDALGQLIRVNDPNDPTAGESGTTWVYEYDRGGNILSKSYYSCLLYTSIRSGIGGMCMMR